MTEGAASLSSLPLATADLCDRLGAAAQVCHLPWRSYGGRTVARGPAATVQCLEDAALVRELLSSPGHGRILVVDGGGSLRAALLGERMARLALDSGWAGIVVHGAVRDVAALRGLDMAVLALGQVPARGGRTGAGRQGVALHLGQAVLHPGDLVCLDEDGLVVLAAAHGQPRRPSVAL
ncbi:ribonuclease E activity regulator RraA [Delftia tsuruhatensis]